MAKTSAVQKNKRREKLSQTHAAKRALLKSVVMDRTLPVEERFEATLKLAQLPRNGAANRVRLRCELTGRARGNYRKFKLSRNMLREMANTGQLPGVTKASW
jgi:small subunit ribosomal protein S14